VSTTTSSRNVPSPDEAARVVDFVVNDVLKPIAAGVANGTHTADSLREILALTIAVVGATEQLYQHVGKHVAQWEAMERSATTFMDEHVVKALAANDIDLKRALTRHRRRKLAAKAGKLRLVESDRNKRARWAAVTLPEDAPIPISEQVGEGLGELMHDVEERVYQHLAAVPAQEPLVLAGQIVGLLCASEFLLALFPSNKVAAFCVHLAQLTAASEPHT
jgi:hypothetical protein